MSTFEDLLRYAVPILLGGVGGATVTICHQRMQSRRECRALALAFASELVSAFERCVHYKEQYRQRTVSYSALFTFTDSGALARFASVCRKPEVTAAIIDLKSYYFQVSRHIARAADLAVEAGQVGLQTGTQDRLMESAQTALGIALAFFEASYARIEEKMLLLVSTVQELSPGDVATELSSRFSTARQTAAKLVTPG